MKKKLLLVLFIVFTVTGYSQTVANTPPNLSACSGGFDYNIMDLTVQTPIILGEQDPENFTVTYYQQYYSDPETGTNPIEDPQNYGSFVSIAPDSEIIYARVDNNNDDSYAVTSFEVTNIALISYEVDLELCDGYHLSYLNIGNYYTEPGGMGTMYESGDILPVPTTLYVYAEYEGCILQGPGVTTTGFAPLAEPIPPLYGCDANADGAALFNMEELIPELTMGVSGHFINFYETLENAENDFDPILNIGAYTNIIPNSQTIYVKKYDLSSCESIAPMELIAAPCDGNVVFGTVTYDLNNNGCTEESTYASGVQVSYNDGTNEYFCYTDGLGNYSFIDIPEGEATISIVDEEYIATPSSYVIAPNGEEEITPFCLSAANPVNDIAVTFIPYTNAVPGFEATYKLIVQNLGSYTADGGTITVTFDDTKLDFTSANPEMTQSGNTLSISFSNIQPFQPQVATIHFDVMIPPTVNGGDILDFAASLLGSDDNVDNNISELNQTVVNSFDPNDIRVNEGEFITEEQAEGYLHYTIRLQNEGNGNAINIRIEDILDENLDWDTFQPVAGSHNYEALRNGNEVEFKFNNINLPYTDADEEGSHGFVSYRIKPVNTIALGDVMSASAGIYFDFNPPVLTNTVTTTVQNPAGIEKNTLSGFTIYPNPSSGTVNISVQNFTEKAIITVTDILGKAVLDSTIEGSETSLDISSLNSGVYFITLDNDKYIVTKKLVIK